MAESPKLPAVVTLPALPKTPDECPAWAARLTVTLVQHFRRVIQALPGAATTSATVTLLGFDKLNVAGGQTSLPASAVAASPPTFLSVVKWTVE